MRFLSVPIISLAVLLCSIPSIKSSSLLIKPSIEIKNEEKEETELNQLRKDAEKAENSLFFNKAIELRKKILKISMNIYELDHPETATASLFLGLLYRDLGQYEKAEPYLRQTVEIDKKVYGLDHTETATAKNILGLLYSDLGQFKKAESLLKQALKTYKKEYGLQHPRTASILNNLGFLYKDLHQYKEAESLLKKALKVYKKNPGFEDKTTSTVLKNLGLLYGEIGQYKRAESLLKQSLDIRKKIFKHDNPRIANALNDLGFLYKNLGQYEKAEPLLKQSLEIYKKAYGLQHPRTLMALNHLGLLYMNLGQYEKANPLLKLGITVNSILIQREAPYLAISNRRAYVDSLGDSYENVYFKISENLSNKRLAFFSRINLQGLLEEIEKRQSQLGSLPGPQQQIAAQLRNINQKIANIGVDQQQRQFLIAERERLEIKLYRILPQLKPRITEIEDIARNIPKGSLLIEFQRYKPVSLDQHFPVKSWPLQNMLRWFSIHLFQRRELTPARYVAMVLDTSKKEHDESGRLTNYKIHAIDLGLAEPLEQKIKQALNASEKGLKDAASKWKEIGELIIQPLDKATKGSKTWFISPDGELNRIPFAALSGANGDGLLGEQVQIRLLTTGRELFNLEKVNEAEPNVSLVVANPSFDPPKAVSPDSQQTVSSFELIASQKRSAEIDTFKWRPLPGTNKEGKIIANEIDATLLVEEKATAQAIIKTIDPKILHIASHSFYLANQPENEKDTYSAVQVQSFAKGENPLLRSGIVLAGANKPDAKKFDDGYLTALELANLDLSATEMVVVSGCESGKGDIQAGESVYGLKRAIAVAGARSSLLSLWKVDDNATAEFMESFYRRLKKGDGRADALAATQKEFRNHPDPSWRHPYVWAAFQLSGDWRPINLD